MKPWIVCIFLLIPLSASAIECMKPADDVKTVLVIHSVTASGSAPVNTEDFEKRLREDLNTGGKFRVVLEDQYRYAKKNKLVDRCTPAFITNINIKNDSVDVMPNGLLRGVLVMSGYTATVNVKLIEDSVTVDDFSVDGKKKSPTTGKNKGNSLQNLYENVVTEFNTRQSTWTSGKAPGF